MDETSKSLFDAWFAPKLDNLVVKTRVPVFWFFTVFEWDLVLYVVFEDGQWEYISNRCRGRRGPWRIREGRFVEFSPWSIYWIRRSKWSIHDIVCVWHIQERIFLGSRVVKKLMVILNSGDPPSIEKSRPSCVYLRFCLLWIIDSD